MTDRPERAGRPDARPGERPAAAKREQPEVIVVPYRPGRHSAKLLPPLLLVLAGTGFLAYRARSADWRGISSLFEPRHPLALAATSPPPPAKPDAPAEPAPAPPSAAEPAPSIAPAPADQAKAEKPAGDDKDKDKAKAGPKPGAETTADPLDDIRREAEKTKSKIAELEALKAKEAQKLEETADERAQADRRDKWLNPRFGLGGVPPQQIEEMLRAQHELLRRQMNGMVEFQRRQMEQMAAIQREFFGQRGGQPGVPAGRAFPPMPRPMPLPPMPGFDAARPGRFQRLPDGGVARFHEFRGPNGMQGFRFEFRQGGPSPDDNDDNAPAVPPPPRPRPID